MKNNTMESVSNRQLKNNTSFGQAVRNSFTMAYRGLLKIRRTPEQLFDVTLQPNIFTLMFTYIFGGAISKGAFLPFLKFYKPKIYKLLFTTCTFSAYFHSINILP